MTFLVDFSGKLFTKNAKVTLKDLSANSEASCDPEKFN